MTLELEHFLSQKCVVISLLNEAFLNTGQTFRLGNYVCHRTDRPTARGDTNILVPRGIVHHSLPGQDPTHLEATTIQVLAAYLSPSCPTIGADLTAYFGGKLSVFMGGELYNIHVNWNSLQNTRWMQILRNYVEENSCLIFGSKSQTINTYNTSVTPDVLHIMITKKFSFPVYLTSRSVLSSEHLPVLIDTSYRSFFHHKTGSLYFKHTDSVDNQTHF
jgi:hypothetical protein